jgi:hypothetical protein
MLVKHLRAQLGPAGHPELGVDRLDVVLDGVTGDPQRAGDLVDLPDGGLGPASAEELQRAACAVMAFGFAEVTTVDQVLGWLPVAALA